ncbi:MHS family MFS transporter [Leucobacter viscericola]|uniref:MHS family MFS transporter n=1 Tax=Leucobacter viscericola TaxID=2714935 RepID=A0A6G7XGG9_9MICO|nr:MHS family MFS transporter [Leucobacter viscericola]QIK63602.1 MHS family MFS transporter [Leucobacter viscericola]
MQLRAALSGDSDSAFERFDFAIYCALSATNFPQLFFSGRREAGGLSISTPLSRAQIRDQISYLRSRGAT